MKAALLLCLMLAGCATVPDARCNEGGGCFTLTKAALIKAMQAAWNDGYTKSEENAPPSCRRSI